MNSFDIPRNFITVLAALVLALALTALPNASAFAEEISIIDIQPHKSAQRASAPQDDALQDRGALRRLLADPQREPQEQRQLDRALDGVLEELA